MSQQILQCFFGADLRGGHNGLSKLARKHDLDVRTLTHGQYVIFINSAKDKMKLFAASNVIAYLKLERGQKIDLNAIREIPRVFRGTGRIDYDAALREAITSALKKTYKGRNALDVYRAERQAGLSDRH